MYTIAYDSKVGLVRMSVSGFWSRHTVEAFFAELIPVLSRVRATGHRVLALSDAREFPIQAAEVGEAFARGDPAVAKLRDRMAVVVGSTLGRMQARRFTGPKLEFFTSFDEAERWLWSDIDLAGMPAQSH